MNSISPTVALTRQLIGFDTRDPGGSEAECVELLDRILSRAGFTVANIDAATTIYQRIAEKWYGLPPDEADLKKFSAG